MEFLSVVGAPRMKGDEEGDRYIVFVRGKEDGRLFGTIYGTGDTYLADLAIGGVLELERLPPKRCGRVDSVSFSFRFCLGEDATVGFSCVLVGVDSVLHFLLGD